MFFFDPDREEYASETMKGRDSKLGLEYHQSCSTRASSGKENAESCSIR